MCDEFTHEYAINRTGTCGIFAADLTIYEEINGVEKEIGVIDMNLVDYSYTSASQFDWGHQMSLDANGWSGAGQTGKWSVAGSARVSGPARPDSQDFPSQVVMLNKYESGTSFFQSTATAVGAVGAQASTTWTWTFTSPVYGASTPAHATIGGVRCDNALPGFRKAGCVFPAAVPTLDYYSNGTVPQLARHIAAAERSGLPSRLTRLVNRTLQDKNNSKACPRKYPRPAGDTCDEYPFQSSNQGAYTGGGSPRTSSFCHISGVSTTATGAKGYSVCMINGPQNSAGGTALLSFYNKYRVIGNDAFTIGVTTK